MMSLITLVLAVSAGVVASVPAAHAATLYDSPTWAQMERAIAAAEGREYVETKAVRRDPTFDQMERLIRAIPGAGGGGCDTNAVDALANSAVVTNAITISTTNRVSALETATNNLSSSVSGLASSKADKAAPSYAGNLAALTADGNLEDSGKNASDFLPAKYLGGDAYEVNANTTFEYLYGDALVIDPYSHYFYGARFFYDPSGTESIYDDANEIAVKGDISAAISATNQAFSTAVLSVNVDFATNTTGAAYVAVTNALAGFGFDAEALAELPGGKVYGSIGALLAALAAAVAWLKKKALIGGLTGGVPDDPKVHDFFTNSNSLLTGTIDEEIIEKGTAPDAHLEAPTDERLKLVLADNSVAYDSAKALPYKLTSVIGDRVIATMTLTAASTDITLPTIAANDTTVKDFILDVTNAYAVEGVATDAGINIPRTDFKLVTRDGESLTDVTTVKAGKSAFLCFTQKSPVVVDGTTYPCWCVIQLPFGDPS